MQNKKNKGIIKNILFLACFFVVSLIPNVKALPTVTGEYRFGFSAYECSGTKAAEFKSCREKYYKGQLAQLDTSQGLPAGKKIMLVLEYTHGFAGNISNAAVGFNTNLIFDTDYVSLMTYGSNNTPAAFAATEELNPVFAFSEDEMGPYGFGYDEDEAETFAPKDSWNANVTSPSEEYPNLVIFNYERLRDDVLPFAYEPGAIGFVFFEVKEDAPEGSNFTFYLDRGNEGDATWMSNSSTDAIPFQAEPITLKTAGESTSSDNSLKTFTAKGSNNIDYTVYEDSNYTTAFGNDTTVRDYYMVVPNHVTSITLNLATNHENAQIVPGNANTLTRTYQLNNIGENEIEFFVSAEDVTNSTYKLYVYRLSADASLQSLSTSGNTTLSGFSSGTLNYNITTIYNNVSTNVTAKPTHTNAFVTNTEDTLWTKNNSTGNYTQSFALPGFGTDVNTKVIKVQAEDALAKYASVPDNTPHTQNYTINVTRENPSTDVTLRTLKVDDTSILVAGQTDYNQGVQRYATASVDITAQANDSKATVKGETGNQALNIGNWTTLTVTVEAEDCKVITGSNPSPNCHSQDYTIKFYRNDNNANLDSLVITGTGISMTPSLADDHTFAGPYVVSFPSGTESVNISATTEDEEAIITGLTGATGLGSNEISGSYTDLNNQLQLIVTAEDGNQKTYTIRFSKILAKEAKLASLTVSGARLNPTFNADAEVYSYSTSVDGDVEQVTIGATLKDPDNATFITETDGGVETYYGPRTVRLEYGDNTFYIKTQAEDPNEKKTYIINIKRNQKSIKTLKSISVDGTPIEEFDKDTHSYTISGIPYSKNEVLITAEVTDNSDATYYVANTLGGEIPNGLVNLNTGDNVIDIIVSAQDGSQGKYTLTIKRDYNTDATITGVKVFGEDTTCNMETRKCSITVSNSHSTLSSSDVVVGLNDPNATVIQPESTINLIVTKPSNPRTNSYLFRVKAEDNTTTLDYEVIITRTPSSDNSLSEVVVTNNDGKTYRCQTFDNYSCTITVPSDTTSYTLTATPTAGNIASVTGTGNFTMNGATDSRQERTLTVTAENEISQTYQIIVERGKSTNANLSTITIDGVEIDDFDGVNKQVYSVTVPGTTESITLGALVADTGKAVIEDEASTLGRKNLEYGGNTYTIKVIAEAGGTAVKTYTLTITRDLNIDSSLSMIQVKGENLPGFNKDTLSYDYSSEYYQNLADSNPLMVPYTTTSIVVVGTPSDTAHATVAYKVDDNDTPSTVNLHTGLNTIKIIGIAHNTSVKTEYVLKVYRALNTNNSITSITVAGVTAEWNATANKYTVTVPNNVTSIGPSNVEVVVPDPQLPTDPKATITIPSMNLVTDDPVNGNINNYQVTVTSESNQPKTYNVEVTRTKSAVNTLSALTVTGGAFDPSFLASRNYVDGDKVNVYRVVVGSSTTQFTVNYVKDDSKSSVEVVGGATVTMDESQKTVIIRVTAENGDVNTYTLNVERTESVVMTLSSITVNSGDVSYPLKEEFTPDNTAYTVEVPGTVSEVNIAASVVDNRARIVSGTGVHTLTKDPNQDTFTIRVETEGGSAFLNYTVKVIVLPKTNNNLDNLVVSIPHGTDPATVLSLSPSFDEEVVNYTISDQPYNVSKINIVATTQDVDAELKVNGVVTSSGTISQQTLNVGTNQIPITVKAEDGTEKTYKVTVKRAGNNDASLSNLNISGGTLSPTFDPATKEYTVTLSSTTETLDPNKVTATPTDSNARVTMDGELTITGDATHDVFKIHVTAEDGIATEEYIVNVVRRQDSDATLKSVTLEGATLDGNFLPSNHTYVVNVPSTSTEFTITGTPNSKRAQGVIGNGTYQVDETSTVILTVTAEDGTTDSYTFTIYTASAQDATLANLEVQGYTLNPSFITTTQTYDIGEVYLGVESLNVIGTPTNPNAKVYYYIGQQSPSLSNLVSVPQALGNYTISVKVVPATGIEANAKIYSINFKVVTSGNNYLSSLIPSTGTLNPKFNKLTTSYSMSVPFDIESVSFTAKAEDSSASVAGGDGAYSYTDIEAKTFTASGLRVGSNSYTIHVKAANDEIQDYTISITRNNKVASDDVHLSGLKVDSYIYQETTYTPELSPAFDKDREDYTIGSIPFGVEELVVRPTKNLSVQTISYELNGQTERVGINSDGSGVIRVNDRTGSNIIGVTVTAENGDTKTYQITYTRTPSSNVYLESMVDPLGKITDFNKTKVAYSINVDSTVSTMRITLTTEEKTSSITIGGETKVHQWIYTTPTLVGGANTVNILITAENGATKTYTLVINKEGASELITSRTFGHDISDGMIKSAILGNTILDLKNQLDNDNSKLQIWDANETSEITDSSKKVATGQIVKLVDLVTGRELDRKVVVVIGDVDGNGSISLFDSVKIVNHYLEKTLLTGAYLKAADVDKNTKISLFDSVKIVNHYLEKTYIDYSV